jgi:uncharacterized membrane protein
MNFPVECKRCRKLLYGLVKFCPFCGKAAEDISPPSPLPPKGPVIEGLSISAPGESGRVVVMASAHSEDGLDIEKAEWWIGDDPGRGKGNSMQAVGGSFKSSRVDIIASINVNKFQPGKYLLHVRSADKTGQWGSPQSINLTAFGPEPSATLHVSTSPAGAQVIVDGVQIDTTPLSIESMTSGEHSLAISKAGYETRNEKINIASGEKKTVEYPLMPKQATLQVDTIPSGARLTLDGNQIGITSVSIENITPGKHSLIISKPGYKNRNEWIDIAVNEKKTVEYLLIKRDGHLWRNAIVGILIAACLFVSYKIISRPKEKAQLFVSTSPTGASLTIDGKSMGPTQKAGISVAVESGTHHIVVEKEGYLRNEQDVSVHPGEKKSVAVTLEKRGVDFAEVRITTTPDQAVVFVDGNRKGRTPLSLKNITPGEHSLTISKGGYEERNEQITVASGKKKDLEYVLISKQQPAALLVNTSPSGAQLTVDGTQVGKTPASIQDITPGGHSLTLSKEGYQTRSERVSIASGEKKSVEYPLTPIPIQEATLYVNTSPPGAVVTVDGMQGGRTPTYLRRLSIGEHVISVFIPGYIRKEQTVYLSQRDNRPLNILLEEEKVPADPARVEAEVSKALRDKGLRDVYADVNRDLVATLQGFVGKPDDRAMARGIVRGNRDIKDVRDNIFVLHFTPPNPTIPRELTAFLGVWEGAWNGIAPCKLAVERINLQEANLIYGAAGEPREGFMRKRANVAFGNSLRWGEGSEPIYIFMMGPDLKSISGKYEYQGKVLRLTMSKRE